MKIIRNILQNLLFIISKIIKNILQNFLFIIMKFVINNYERNLFFVIKKFAIQYLCKNKKITKKKMLVCV